MFKNVAGQAFSLFAYDTDANAPKSGDAANITATVLQDWDGSASLLDGTAADLYDGTTDHLKGHYQFRISQAETNADYLLLSAISSTADVEVDSAEIFTTRKLGAPVALDGGDATIAGMLAKLADDNGGATYDAATDSQNKQAAAVTALNNLSAAESESAADAALATYDGPTNAEMEARTLVAATYATAAALASVATDVTLIRKIRQNRLEFDLPNSKAYIWNDAGGAREYEADLTNNAGAAVTTSTTGPINCSRWTAI